MTLNEYQSKALETAVYPGSKTPEGIKYTTLGLVGEAGEVAQKLKKFMRGDIGDLKYVFTQDMAYEISDCLWYIATLAYELGYDLDDIAEMNLSKLARRKQAGTIKGEGDNR